MLIASAAVPRLSEGSTSVASGSEFASSELLGAARMAARRRRRSAGVARVRRRRRRERAREECPGREGALGGGGAGVGDDDGEEAAERVLVGGVAGCFFAAGVFAAAGFFFSAAGFSAAGFSALATLARGGDGSRGRVRDVRVRVRVRSLAPKVFSPIPTFGAASFFEPGAENRAAPSLGFLIFFAASDDASPEGDGRFGFFPRGSP